MDTTTVLLRLYLLRPLTKMGWSDQCPLVPALVSIASGDQMPQVREGKKQEVPRGFEPRSLDSESRVLTVTPRDQVMVLEPLKS